jgi:non-homologous end joining protein Ku
VIDSKRRRKRIHAPRPEKEPSPVPDLMAALEQTLENVKAGRSPCQEAKSRRRKAGAPR